MSRSLPAGWAEIPLGMLFSLDTPGFWGDDDGNQCTIKVLRATNFKKDGSLNYSTAAMRSFPEKKVLQKSLQNGDIILERSGGSPTQPVGRVAYFLGGEGYSASNFMQILRADEQKVLSLYCFYLMDWFYRSGGTEVLQKATTGIRNLDYQTYKGTLVKLPPLPEQHRIAEIISSVDEAIQTTQVVAEQSRKVRQGVLKRLLTKGIGHTRFKQTEIGEIPDEWTLTTAGKVCEQISVGIVVRPAQYYIPEGVKCFRSANVREGQINDSDWVYISPESNELLKKSQLRTGDVLVVRSGYTGTSCVVTPDYDGTNCVDIIFARPKKREINSDFLSAYINSPVGRDQVLRAEGGLAQKHFNVGEMKKMVVPLPPISEQEAIADRLLQMKQTEQSLVEHGKRLARLKAALMSDLLTGRKRVITDLSMAAE
jgi:type I restriction enzyme S subunit